MASTPNHPNGPIISLLAEASWRYGLPENVAGPRELANWDVPSLTDGRNRLRILLDRLPSYPEDDPRVPQVGQNGTMEEFMLHTEAETLVRKIRVITHAGITGVADTTIVGDIRETEELADKPSEGLWLASGRVRQQLDRFHNPLFRPPIIPPRGH